MNAFTDWQPTMQSMIERYKPKRVFEFGMGDGTQFLLDNFDYVYSFELLCNPELKDWYPNMVERYKNNSKWHTMFMNCDDEINFGLRMQLSKYLKLAKPDLVFVDPGVHFRGDLVNLAIKGGYPIVMAHDTRCGFDENDIYGWNKIKAEGYTKEEVYTGQGTTAWIRNDLLGN